MSKRYIDADALIKNWPEGFHRTKDVIDAAPTADVRPNEHGQWIDFSMSVKGVPTEACGNCGEWSLGMGKNFCPNCGADMRGDKE